MKLWTIACFRTALMKRKDLLNSQKINQDGKGKLCLVDIFPFQIHTDNLKGFFTIASKNENVNIISVMFTASSIFCRQVFEQTRFGLKNGLFTRRVCKYFHVSSLWQQQRLSSSQSTFCLFTFANLISTSRWQFCWTNLFLKLSNASLVCLSPGSTLLKRSTLQQNMKLPFSIVSDQTNNNL